MEFDPDQKFAASPDVLFQEVSGEMVLLDLASEKYFGLDEIGAEIWRLLQGGSTVGQVMKSLQEEYDVDRAVLENDVGDLLGKLIDEGLLTKPGV